MTCPCNDTKRKMPRCDAGTPPVLEVSCGETPVLFHTVTIPASIGTLETMPPQPGAYRNARVIYEADKATYLYDSDGIPQLLVPDTEAIIAEAVSQIPTATTTADGLMSAADKAKLDALDDNVYSENETVVGTWIDGKPLYRKTVNCGGGPNAGRKDVPAGISNPDKIVNLYGFSVEMGACIPVNNARPDNTTAANGAYFENGNIVIRTGVDRSNATFYITVEYTKTTD